MARKTKQEKVIEAAVDAAFKKHGSGKQFNIMDLSKISDAGRAVAAEGLDKIEAAVVAAIEKYQIR